MSGEIRTVGDVGDVGVLRGGPPDHQKARSNVGVAAIPLDASGLDDLLRLEHKFCLDVERVIDALRRREEPLHLLEHARTRTRAVDADLLDAVFPAKVADRPSLILPGGILERDFLEYPELSAHTLRREGMPLFSLENRLPLGSFDIVGFSLLYEMCYTNILTMLELSSIPFLAKERGEDMPLILAGGPCAVNPDPP